MATIFWKLWRMKTVLYVVLIGVQTTFAQTGTAIPQNVEDALRQISDRADVIFLGHVTAIYPHINSLAASGFVEINFGIDQAVRGCEMGGTYTLREWAGLWTANSHRYQTGQRLLMILHAPGPSGLSSPVGGMDGAIPIRGGGAASLLPNSYSVARTSIVDLRWLGAGLLHPASYTLNTPMAPTPLGLPQQTSAASATALIVDPITTEGTRSGRASVPVQQASVDTVVKLLTSWQKVLHENLR